MHSINVFYQKNLPKCDKITALLQVPIILDRHNQIHLAMALYTVVFRVSQLGDIDGHLPRSLS